MQRCGYVMRSNYNGYNTYFVLSGGAVAPPMFCLSVGSAKPASEFFADSRRLKSYTTPGEPPRKRHRLDTGSFQNLQHSHRYGGYTNWVNA